MNNIFDNFPDAVLMFGVNIPDKTQLPENQNQPVSNSDNIKASSTVKYKVNYQNKLTSDIFNIDENSTDFFKTRCLKEIN
jgi:hypothetical protein